MEIKDFERDHETELNERVTKKVVGFIDSMKGVLVIAIAYQLGKKSGVQKGYRECLKDLTVRQFRG